MNRMIQRVFLFTSVLSAMLMLGACSAETDTTVTETPSSGPGSATEANAAAPVTEDVIARVGDQPITFSEINILLNSSAVVGLSIPALGTPERDVVRITLLDRLVDANLIYLDALRKGVDQDPKYRHDIQYASQGLLGGLYKRHLQGDVTVTDQEIMDFYNESVVPGTELTEEARLQIESTLRKQKVEAKRANLRKQLREGIEITVYQKNFDPDGDEGRPDDVPVAEAGELTISWGEVKTALIASGVAATDRDPLAMVTDARLQALQTQIDIRLMAQKARTAGLQQDPVYRRRMNEYRKTRLINIHRENLIREMAPTDAEVEAYFEENRHRISMPEFRKVQMIVLPTEAEAEDIKRRIEAGELTMYEAVARHSIAPDAKKDLGEIGWIQQGRAQPGLEEVVFSLGPGEIGGPVPVGDVWHIMRVEDVREGQRQSLDEAATRKEARRQYIHDKLNEYTVNLRKNDFTVEVYEDKLIELAQREADMVAQLAEQAGKSGSVTRERLKELQKYITRPPPPQ